MKKPSWRSRLAVALVGAQAVAAGCSSSDLEVGEIGQPRVAGLVRGPDPLRVLPPVVDHAGNVYVLQGAIDFPQTLAVVGRTGGGWKGGCAVTKGDDFGAHGWVGFTDHAAWYWSGGALVRVTGDTGDCRKVLDRDPVTGASLFFIGVTPWVRDQPSQTAVAALIDSPADRSAFFARVDLRANIYTHLHEFEPLGSVNVKVLGVGATDIFGGGVFLLRFEHDGALYTEARYTDEFGNVTAKSPIALPDDLPAYDVRGYLQVSSGGLAAGLLSDGRVVAFDKSGGKIIDAPPLDPRGVHAWDGRLYVVGVADGRPAIVEIRDNVTYGSLKSWASSERLAGALARPLELIDDRTLPSRRVTWNTPRSAVGEFPLLSAHPPPRVGDKMTAMLIAGPAFDFAGDRMTLIGMAPVGVEYP